MRYRSSVAVQLIILALAAVTALVFALQMPDQVPIHWGLNGKPDAWGSKWLNVCLGPGLVVFNVFLTLLLPRLSPSVFARAGLMDIFSRTMILTSLLMFTLGVVIAKASITPHLDVVRVIMGVTYAFIGLIGMVTRNVPPNPYVGIRTKWTLSSERVWTTTHHRAATFWLFTGVLGLILAAAGMPIILLTALLLVMVFWPIWLSYALSRTITG